MAGLIGDVGSGSANNPDDVRAVQTHLRRHANWLSPTPAPEVTGRYDLATGSAIQAFQRNAVSYLNPDGIVSRQGLTIRRLETTVLPRPRHAVFQEVCCVKQRANVSRFRG